MKTADGPGIVIKGQSKEGKERRVVLKRVMNQTHRIQIEIIGNAGREMGMSRVEISDLLVAVEQVPELKRAFVNAVWFRWRS